MYAAVTSLLAWSAAASPACVAPPTTRPGGKPVIARPGATPRSPMMVVGPVLVTVEPPRTRKLAATPRVGPPTADCAAPTISVGEEWQANGTAARTARLMSDAGAQRGECPQRFLTVMKSSPPLSLSLPLPSRDAIREPAPRRSNARHARSAPLGKRCATNRPTRPKTEPFSPIGLRSAAAFGTPEAPAWSDVHAAHDDDSILAACRGGVANRQFAHLARPVRRARREGLE